MSTVVHWLPTAVLNGRLACGRPTTLRSSSGRFIETPLCALLVIPSHGYRWCKSCLRERRKVKP